MASSPHSFPDIWDTEPFLEALRSLDVEWEVGPQGDHWFTRGAHSYGPMLFPPGGVPVLAVEATCKRLNIQMLDVYLAAVRAGMPSAAP